jgi:hypothetical protein
MYGWPRYKKIANDGKGFEEDKIFYAVEIGDIVLYENADGEKSKEYHTIIPAEKDCDSFSALVEDFELDDTLVGGFMVVSKDDKTRYFDRWIFRSFYFPEKEEFDRSLLGKGSAKLVSLPTHFDDCPVSSCKKCSGDGEWVCDGDGVENFVGQYVRIDSSQGEDGEITPSVFARVIAYRILSTAPNIDSVCFYLVEIGTGNFFSWIENSDNS